MKLTAGEAGRRKAMGTENKFVGTQWDGKYSGQWERKRFLGFEEQKRQSKVSASPDL